MADDDLDLDLDLDTEAPDKKAPAVRKRGLFARKPKPAPAPKEAAAPAAVSAKATPTPAAPRPAAPAAAAADAAGDKPVTVMAARKPGLFARMLSPVSSRMGRLHAPTWNLRNFGLGVLVLALLVLVVENWPPMRLSFLGLHVDLPKALVLLVVFALGFLVAWLPGRRKAPERSDA